jgi:uncharacterized protein (DUF433 family)
MRTFTAESTTHANWLRDILRCCDRHQTLHQSLIGWEVRTQSGDLVDQDTDFDQLFWRCYAWEEDVPGYEGLLWRSPARCSGNVCIKGTRIWVQLVKGHVAAGDDPLELWDYLTPEQIAAAICYDGPDEPDETLDKMDVEVLGQYATNRH